MRIAAALLLIAVTARLSAAPAPPPNPGEMFMVQARDLYGSCDGQPKTASATSTVVTSWTGRCADGWRDGVGRLTTITTTSGAYPSTFTTVSDGIFVSGKQAGMWCTVEQSIVTTSSSASYPEAVGRCQLHLATYAAQSQLPQTFRKLPAGDWEPSPATAWNEPTGIVIGAATMEALTARAIDEVRTAPKPSPYAIPLAATMLKDLMPDAAITLIVDPADYADVTGKRLAVILSSGAVAELDRFARERAVFVKAKGYGVKALPADLDKLVAAADASRLVPSIAAVLRPLPGGLITADDLSILSSGGAEYALVIDWRYKGGLALKPKKLAALPECAPGAAQPCEPVFAERLSALLIDSKLRARRIFLPSSADATRFGTPPDYLANLTQAFATRWPLDASLYGGDIADDLTKAMSPKNMNLVAVRYDGGKGMVAAKSRAFGLYLAAHYAGSDFATYNLGLDYLYGDGAPLNVVEGLRYLKMASDAGNYYATNKLTALYVDGKTVAKNLPEAARYSKREFAQAAENEGSGAYNYGLSLEYGYTGVTDLPEALRLYKIAAARGSADAPQRIAELEPKVAAMEAAKKAAEEASAAAAAAATAPASVPGAPGAAASSGSDRTPGGICRDKLAENETFLATLATGNANNTQVQLRARWAMYVARSRLDVLDAFCKGQSESRQQRSFVQQAYDSAARDCVVTGDPKLCEPVRPPAK